ncbi:MAG: manganese efflux pump [Ruminococcus sp.]|nr:manganese efflux pump [Ruminococcus sp.]
MGVLELILLSVGLAMDAFSVSVCKGLSMKKLDVKSGIIIASFFGVFQAGMPLMGYLLSNSFTKYISSYSHWVAFILLAVIGGKMLIESITEKEEESEADFSLNIKEILLLAVATSIDALAVGIVFSAEAIKPYIPVLVIGAITFVLSFAGVAIGHKFGNKYEKKAGIAGGTILILIGIKLLLDGLGVI